MTLFQEEGNIDIVFLPVMLDQGKIHNCLVKKRSTSLCFREEKVPLADLKTNYIN